VRHEGAIKPGISEVDRNVIVQTPRMPDRVITQPSDPQFTIEPWRRMGAWWAKIRRCSGSQINTGQFIVAVERRWAAEHQLYDLLGSRAARFRSP
jgi:hypothetical protein